MKKIYRIGCVGLLCDIPLLLASAKGMFAEEGLAVDLTIELGWASLEAKLISRQLTAANLPAVMPLALSLGKGKVPLPVRALAPTAYEGDALLLNAELAAAVKQAQRPSEPIRIGVEAPYTQANLLLRSWLKRTSPSIQASTTAVPLAISQIADFLGEGYIQGFCSSAPLSQIAERARLGVTVAQSRDYFPLHLQSVVAATETFCLREEKAAQAITNALERARAFCAEPINHGEIMKVFSACKSSVFSPSELPRAVLENAAQLRALLGFEASESKTGPSGKDPFEVVTKALRALPGPDLSEQEIRKEARRVYPFLNPLPVGEQPQP